VLAFALALLTALPLMADDAPLARLFYSPQERVRLDMARHSDAEGPPPATSPGVTTKKITLNGIIEKRGGGLHAWLNGKNIDSGELRISVSIGRRLTAEQQLPLRLPGGLTATPKVGQMVNLATGELIEGYQQTKATSPEEVTTEEGSSDIEGGVGEAEPG